MPGTTSRKAYADFIEAAQEDICIIPSEIFTDLLKGKQQRDDDLFSVLNRIANALENGEEQKKKHFQSMEAKMDQIILAQNDSSTFETYMTEIGEKISSLTAAISQSSETIVEKIDTSEKDKESTQKNILKLKDLRGQYMRSEKTSEFIEEGLARNPPYVQRKFRVKMSKETPADEINIYITEATDNAKRDVSKMKIRMKRWEEEINILKAEIATSLSRPNVSARDRTDYEQQMRRDEDLNLKQREDAVKLLKENFETDIRSGADQFLLKYTEDAESGDEARNNDQSKNFSGRYRQRGYRRGDWRGRRPRY